MEDIDGLPLPFLTKIIDFPDGITYELLKPITNFKSCHDGTPAEARILFTCRQTSQSSSPMASHSESEEHPEYIVKIKAQIPTPADSTPEPSSGPSDTTTHEILALQKFRDANTPFAPHLVAFTSTVQAEEGRLPGGYITYTVMTKMPGATLYPGLGYWNLEVSEREEIASAFIVALKGVWALGVEPVDRGLRNVLWERETKTW